MLQQVSESLGSSVLTLCASTPTKSLVRSSNSNVFQGIMSNNNSFVLGPPVFANGTAISNGSYRLLFRALRVTGNPKEEDDYESWLSPIFGRPFSTRRGLRDWHFRNTLIGTFRKLGKSVVVFGLIFSNKRRVFLNSPSFCSLLVRN